MTRWLLVAVAAASPLSAQPQTFTNGIGMELVLAPAGDFLMGCSPYDQECGGDEKPVHNVKISKSFYISKFETTQEQWTVIMGGNPSYFNESRVGAAWAKHPVEQVSRQAAQEFLQKLSEREKNRKYRLPTEAEWEYAARAGTKGAYQDAAVDRAGWSWLNSGGTTHPVGQLRPNPWDLYDMLGNVWEWVEDVYDGRYYRESPAVDPPGPGTGVGGRRSVRNPLGRGGGNHTIRGSSWYWNAKNMRISWRRSYPPHYADYAGGFRVVAEIP